MRGESFCNILMGICDPSKVKITIEMYTASDAAILQKIFSTILRSYRIWCPSINSSVMSILEFWRKIWSEQIAQNNMEIYLINEEDNPAVKKYFVNGWLTVFENISKTGGELNPSSKRGSPCLLLRGEARGHLGAKVLLGLNKINTMREHLHIKYSCSVRCKPPHVSTLAWHESHSETQSSGFSLILVNWLNQGKHLSWPVPLNSWFNVWSNWNKVVFLPDEQCDHSQKTRVSTAD